MKLLPFITVFILTFSSFALASSSSQRARGATVFSESGCRRCHTIQNVGGHKGPDLSGVGRRKSKAAIRQKIVNGSNGMPGFGDVILPNEINDVIAYLRSCREKPAQLVLATSAGH
jgi:ubiquinol-cytochrome c reductase cytochrome b subunit